MEGSLYCLVVSAEPVHSRACGKAFSSGLGQREERLRKVSAHYEGRRLHCSFGATSDIKSDLHELKNK